MSFKEILNQTCVAFQELIKKLNIDLALFYSIAIAFTNMIVKLYRFSFNYGYTKYFKINYHEIQIDLFSVVDLLFFFFIFVIIVAVISFPWSLFSLKNSLVINIVIALVFYLFSLLVYLLFFYDSSTFSVSEMLYNCAFLTIVYLAISLCACFLFSNKSSFIRNMGKYSFSYYLIISMFLLLIFSRLGYVIAKEKTTFDICNKKYAIIYRNDSYFFLAEYDEQTNTININSQKIISKTNVSIVPNVKNITVLR